MINISFIILNWNGNEDTMECLHSIKRYSYGLNVQVVLVDNASKVPLTKAEIAASGLENVIYIENTKNDGFAEGNNVGMREAIKHNPQYILLLNNDTAIVDDSLLQMYNFMEQHRDYGICGAVNYYYSNPENVWQAGCINNFKNGTQNLVTDFDKNSHEPVDVDYVPGSSIMIRTALLEKVGLLDSRYFAYYEENDMCCSVKKAGFKVGFIPSTKILHKVGQSSDSVTKFYLRARNKLLFYKRFSVPFWFTYIFFKEMLKNFIKASLYAIKYKNFKYFRALYFAYADYNHGVFERGSLDKL